MQFYNQWQSVGGSKEELKKTQMWITVIWFNSSTPDCRTKKTPNGLTRYSVDGSANCTLWEKVTKFKNFLNL